MRKEPKQKRSREMVERLLDATAVTIAERGLDFTTTNHIAEKAGVSIGSLYQYFPDKDSLIEALLERMGERLSQAFRLQAETFSYQQRDLSYVARYAIRFGLKMIQQDALTGEIIRNWNRLAIDLMLDPMERLFLVMAQPYFLKNYANYPIENLEAKLYVLINSVMFTAIRYLHQERAVITEKQLVDTLTEMIVTMLEPAGTPPVAEKKTRAKPVAAGKKKVSRG